MCFCLVLKKIFMTRKTSQQTTRIACKQEENIENKHGEKEVVSFPCRLTQQQKISQSIHNCKELCVLDLVFPSTASWFTIHDM